MLRDEFDAIASENLDLEGRRVREGGEVVRVYAGIEFVNGAGREVDE